MRTMTVLAGVLCVGALATAACGSDDGGSGRAAAGSGKLTLKIGYPSANAGYADLYVGIDQGIFAKHGLDVKLVQINSSGQLIPALSSGSVQIAVGAGPNTASAIMKGADLRFIGIAQPRFNGELWTRTNVTSIEQLRGKKFAVSAPNSVGDYMLTALLKKYGIARSDVDVRYVGSVPASVTALQTGSVDAIGLTPPTGVKLGDRFHVIATSTDLPFPLAAYAVKSDFLSSQPEVVKRFLAAEKDALGYVRTHKAQTVDSITKHTLSNDRAGAELAYDFFLRVWSTAPTVPQPLVQQAFQIAAGESGGSAPSDISKYIGAIS